MERLSRIACYFRRPSNGDVSVDESIPCQDDSQEKTEEHSTEMTGRLFGMLESLLLWENSTNSISVVIAFNVLFWGIIVLEVRGFAAAGSAALVIVLCYSSLAAHTGKDGRPPDFHIQEAKTKHFNKIVKMAKTNFGNLNQMRKDQPVMFFTGICTFSIGLWQVGRSIDGVLLTYAVCMSILILPALIVKFSRQGLSNKDWDEIDEFLPAMTSEHLEVLELARETGGTSPARSVDSDNANDFLFNDEDLAGMQIPSYDEGSTDGLEFSELELGSTTYPSGIKFRSGHFEPGYSSEDEDDLELDATKLQKCSQDTDSDSDFEIIDAVELVHHLSS